MSDQFLGEIRIFPFNFAPTGWALCDGQVMPISQNTALFSLLGTSFGGDGKSTFALPDLQGRAPLDFGNGTGLTVRPLGEPGGEPSVTLVQAEMPVHSHVPQAVDGPGDQDGPAGHTWAIAQADPRTQDLMYASSGSLQMSAASLSSAGGGQPHNNLAPYLVMNFCIALQGIFPSRS